MPIKTFLEVHRGNSAVNSKDRKYMSRLTCFDTSVSWWRILISHSLWKAAVKMKQTACRLWVRPSRYRAIAVSTVPIHHSAVSPVKGVWTRHGTRHSERSRKGVLHRRKRWSRSVLVWKTEGT